MFRSKIERLATDQSIDVMLVRCCLTGGDLLPVSIDVVLAAGGLTPFKLEDLALYRHDDDGGLWLVPFGFGGAIRLEAHGLELYLCHPMQRSRNAPMASTALRPTWPNASTRKVRSDADQGQARRCDAQRRGQPGLPAGSGEPT